MLDAALLGRTMLCVCHMLHAFHMLLGYGHPLYYYSATNLIRSIN